METFEEYKQTLITLFEWYRDSYHKKDCGHTEAIESIKTITEYEKHRLAIYEQILDDYLR